MHYTITVISVSFRILASAPSPADTRPATLLVYAWTATRPAAGALEWPSRPCSRSPFRSTLGEYFKNHNTSLKKRKTFKVRKFASQEQVEQTNKT